MKINAYNLAKVTFLVSINIATLHELRENYLWEISALKDIGDANCMHKVEEEFRDLIQIFVPLNKINNNFSQFADQFAENQGDSVYLYDIELHLSMIVELLEKARNKLFLSVISGVSIIDEFHDNLLEAITKLVDKQNLEQQKINQQEHQEQEIKPQDLGASPDIEKQQPNQVTDNGSEPIASIGTDTSFSSMGIFHKSTSETNNVFRLAHRFF